MWESAPNLISHLDARRHLVHNRSVLELGSGTGAVGLAAAALGASQVVLSDADSIATIRAENGWEERGRLATLKDNIRLNGPRAAAASVEAMRWGDDAHISAVRERWPDGFETIVGSDILYSPRMYDALEATIRALAAADALVVLAYPQRHGEEESFLERLAPAFECVSTGTGSAGDDGNESIRIAELRRSSAA